MYQDPRLCVIRVLKTTKRISWGGWDFNKNNHQIYLNFWREKNDSLSYKLLLCRVNIHTFYTERFFKRRLLWSVTTQFGKSAYFFQSALAWWSKNGHHHPVLLILLIHYLYFTYTLLKHYLYITYTLLIASLIPHKHILQMFAVLFSFLCGLILLKCKIFTNNFYAFIF